MEVSLTGGGLLESSHHPKNYAAQMPNVSCLLNDVEFLPSWTLKMIKVLHL